MDGRALTASSFFTCIDFLRPRRGSAGNVCFPARVVKFSVFASKEDAELDHWDQMELKFGRLIGEDPKLTLAKIMSRKVNPDASYLEVEKSFYQKKGKSKEVEGLGLPSSSLDGLNLVRPQLKKEIKLKAGNKPPSSDIKKPRPAAAKPAISPRGRVPNVILRKPTMHSEDDVEDKPSRLRMKPNLSLKMNAGSTKERYSDMTLLKKPQPITSNEIIDKNEKSSGDEDVDIVEDIGSRAKGATGDRVRDFTLNKKPEIGEDKIRLENDRKNLENSGSASVEYEKENDMDDLGTLKSKADATSGTFEETEYVLSSNENGKNIDDLVLGLQRNKPIDSGYNEDIAAPSQPLNDSLDSTLNLSSKATLLGKPKRLDLSLNETSQLIREEAVATPESCDNAIDADDFSAIPALEEHEHADWTKSEDLAKTGDRAEVEIISSSTRGFVVSFGSIVGFIPYRNLSAKWKFLAFESWLRQKGLDPSIYRQNLGTIGNNDGGSQNYASSRPDPEVKNEGELTSDMKLEDLLQIYDREKIKFLSSFVGQKIKVNVVLANRKSRKLIFSIRPKEREDLIEKKRSLMAKLQIGDVVKCCIKKIAYFGIFVEIDGVPALVHQAEVSWDATLNPASYYKIGQVVEAKVHQLDFTLERIFLSLKQITPDPLIEALESVVGDHDPTNGRMEKAEVDNEWAEVESLIQELQKVEGVQAVSKGRFFLSPGLAPMFQVYMASMYENQYKLLARSGNKVQELMVQTSLDKEAMKSAILTCTNSVE